MFFTQNLAQANKVANEWFALGFVVVMSKVASPVRTGRWVYYVESRSFIRP